MRGKEIGGPGGSLRLWDFVKMDLIKIVHMNHKRNSTRYPWMSSMVELMGNDHSDQNSKQLNLC